ncbi:hypothetical protein I4U23_031351 [Adineta vaga]|nr:hypothetical protein I4U23_031351 [Adineta vaga]
MKSVLYFIFLHCIVAVPQMNLYFTDQVNVNLFDELGVRYNCLRFFSNLKHKSVSRDIISLCMSESSSTLTITNDEEDSIQRFSFDDLAKRNITSEELYQWSIPIDTIEQYQYYLQSNDSSLTKEFIYNCTLPRFGPMCQYELYYYHQNYSTLLEMIHGYYQNDLHKSNGTTFYTHLKCNRGYAPVCLDWSEICDGKVDCLDGNYDEEHCWQLELNECQENEFKCTIGQCIPNEFLHDRSGSFDCIDRSDEITRKYYSKLVITVIEQIFGKEDARCETTFLTSSCDSTRSDQLIDSMFSIKDRSISDKCLFAFPSSHYQYITFKTISEVCIPTIRKEWPDVLYFPNIPLFFGHIYTVYKKNDLLFQEYFLPPYLCLNKSFHNVSLNLIPDMSMNDTKCFILPEIELPAPASMITIWQFRYMDLMSHIFHDIKNFNPIVNFPPNPCNTLNLYQCINSSKCISFHRLLNGKFDCPYNDDENISEDTNSQLFDRFKDKYYHCFYTNKYISKTRLFDGYCDCYLKELGFCEDEDEYKNHTTRTMSFQTMCDTFKELHLIEIDKQNHTDETECDQWECDNIYTRCDRIWNCENGKDETGCDITTTIFNCSLNTQICVTLDKLKLSCLSIDKINDGQIDCLGATDERKQCNNGLFHCINRNTSRCLTTNKLCNNLTDCLTGDDEQFCQKNRSIPNYETIYYENHCHHGLDLRVWLNQTSNNYTNTCLCPPAYYGSQCQYQNQRLSLSLRFYASIES